MSARFNRGQTLTVALQWCSVSVNPFGRVYLIYPNWPPRWIVWTCLGIFILSSYQGTRSTGTGQSVVACAHDHAYEVVDLAEPSWSYPWKLPASPQVGVGTEN